MIAVLVLRFLAVRALMRTFFRSGYISKHTVWPGAPRAPGIQVLLDQSYQYKEYFAEFVGLVGICTVDRLYNIIIENRK